LQFYEMLQSDKVQCELQCMHTHTQKTYSLSLMHTHTHTHTHTHKHTHTYTMKCCRATEWSTNCSVCTHTHAQNILSLSVTLTHTHIQHKILQGDKVEYELQWDDRKRKYKADKV